MNRRTNGFPIAPLWFFGSLVLGVFSMANPVPILFSWSGGKDSALALYELLQQPQWEIVGLLTTGSDQDRPVSHHGVRAELPERQARSLGVPLDKPRVPAR